MKMRSLIQVISTIVLAVVLAVGLQIHPANAQTRQSPTALPGPTVTLDFTLTNGQEKTTQKLANTNALIYLKNLIPNAVPSVTYLITSATEACNSSGGVETNKAIECNPNNATITVKNTTDMSVGPAALQVGITNY